MCPETLVSSRKKVTERPEKVICQECGGGFNLLHRSHWSLITWNDIEHLEV